MIKIIGENEFSTFTKLKQELGVSTGTIYHHLENLSNLIEQKENKKNHLTELGNHAYSSLRKNIIETIRAADLTSKEFKSPLIKGLMLLTPKRLFLTEKKDRNLILIISVIILVLGTIFCALTNSIPFLLFFLDSTDINSLEPMIIPLIFFINFIIFYAIIEVICRLFYNETENSIELLISFGIVLFPMIFYLILHYIWLTLLDISFIAILDRILLIFFQVWSLWLLTFNLSLKKGLKIEKGLTISLLLHYGSFVIILFIAI